VNHDQQSAHKPPSKAKQVAWIAGIAIGGVIMLWLLINVVMPIIGIAQEVTDFVTPDLHDSCEVFAPDGSYGVRVESYVNGSNPLVFLSSTNGGGDWHEFARYNGGSGPPPVNCDKITFIDDMAYFAEWSILHVTQDGGESWFEAWTRPSGSLCYAIESVTFSDPQNGRLLLRCREDTAIGGTNESHTAILLTTNGGETWVNANE
jgi:photosystem II stability/assembly factor-like uncharacterized protein